EQQSTQTEAVMGPIPRKTITWRARASPDFTDVIGIACLFAVLPRTAFRGFARGKRTLLVPTRLKPHSEGTAMIGVTMPCAFTPGAGKLRRPLPDGSLRRSGQRARRKCGGAGRIRITRAMDFDDLIAERAPPPNRVGKADHEN